MNKLIILFIVISFKIFSQDYRLSDQKLYQYHDKKYAVEHDGFSEYAQYLMETVPFIEIATDDSLSTVISDTLTKLYGSKKYINQYKITKNIGELAVKLALDSTTNVVLYQLRGGCDVCKKSLIEIILTDIDLIKVFNSSRITEIYLNYYQVKTPLSKIEFTYINIKRRFGLDQIFILYSDIP